MNIGIIIHSPKGPTKYIAEKLVKTYEKQGNTVRIEELKEAKLDIDNDNQNLQLESYPNLDNYETIVIGAPLIKGELSPVMVKYLSQLPHSENKEVSGYITQFSIGTEKKGLKARDIMIDLIVKKNIKVKQVENIKFLNPFLGKDI